MTLEMFLMLALRDENSFFTEGTPDWKLITF